MVRAALTDDTRAPQLTGVLMVATETGLRLVATDSYRLAFRDLQGVSALPAGSEVLVPARALAEIQRLDRRRATEATRSTLVFRHSELDAVFDVGEVQAHDPAPPRTLPGLRAAASALVPELADGPARGARLGAAARPADGPGHQGRDAPRSGSAFSPDGAELTVLTAESGRAAERVERRLLGEELVGGLQPELPPRRDRGDPLGHVVLEVIDSTKPATLRGEGEDDYRYLLMPVRVS